jgi:hypothetical protein
MANGLEDLQNSVTGLGRDLKTALSDMVSAHDAEDGERFEDAAGQANDLISQIQSLGKADNQATKAGQSPSPAVDLKQNAGPVEGDEPRASRQEPKAATPPREERDVGERDVVVKGRDMPD